jgi:microcompartment protein CcmK/EutM
LYVAKVVGNVVATIKDPNLTGVKLLVVQLLDDDGNPTGDPFVAADGIGVSGVGDKVYLAVKREAAIVLPPPYGPIDAAITGFIDEYTVYHDEDKYRVSMKKPKPPPEPSPPPKEKIPTASPELPATEKKKRPEAEIRSPLPQDELEEGE